MKSISDSLLNLCPLNEIRAWMPQKLDLVKMIQTQFVFFSDYCSCEFR